MDNLGNLSKWYSEEDVLDLQRRMSRAQKRLEKKATHPFESRGLDDALRECEHLDDTEPIACYFRGISSTAYKPHAIAIAIHGFCSAHGLPFLVVTHDVLDKQSAASDTAILKHYHGFIKDQLGNPEIPIILKTVTLGVRAHGRKVFLMLSELGDLLITRELEMRLHDIIGLSAHALKHNLHINDPELDVAASLGLAPGNVGPFPYFVKNIDHLLYRTDPSMDSRRLTALRFTPTETLVLTKRVCEASMVAWLRHIDQKILFFTGCA